MSPLFLKIVYGKYKLKGMIFVKSKMKAHGKTKHVPTKKCFIYFSMYVMRMLCYLMIFVISVPGDDSLVADL